MPWMVGKRAAAAAAAGFGLAMFIAPASAHTVQTAAVSSAAMLADFESVQLASLQDGRGDRGGRGGDRGDRGGRRGDDSGRRGDRGGQRGDRGDRGGQRREDAGPPTRRDGRDPDARPSRRSGDRLDQDGGQRRAAPPPQRQQVQRQQTQRQADRRDGYRDQRRADRRYDRRDQRSADRRYDRRDAYREGRRDQRRADRRYDRRDAYRQGRRDQRHYDRRIRSGAYRHPSRYGGRYYGHGHGPRRGHGYFCSVHNIFHYYSGYNPIGWAYASFGWDLYSRRYLDDCDVVSQTFYRRGRRFEEVALLCYDEWGYGYIRPGSRRVYRSW